jgi:hypothetical protein
VTQVQTTSFRTVGAILAPFVAELELRQPAVVTKRLLGDIASEVGSDLDPTVIAERLVRQGWLLPLRTRDAWEFAPGARAGRYPGGDPWIELRAFLVHRPEAPVAIAFESAIWEYGYTSHQPDTPVLGHRPGWRAPGSLSVRTASFDWRLPTGAANGLPVWQPATTLAAIAHRPSAQGDWGNADEWLPETFRATTPDDVLLEASGRGRATLARLGHLAEWSGRRDIADETETLLEGHSPSVTYLGPRDRRGSWINRWHLYDSLLPPR